MYLLNVHVLGVSVDVHLELTFHSGLVGGDGGTLDTNIVLPDGLSTLHSHYRKEGKHAVHVKLGQNSRPEINQIHMYMYTCTSGGQVIIRHVHGHGLVLNVT